MQLALSLSLTACRHMRLMSGGIVLNVMLTSHAEVFVVLLFVITGVKVFVCWGLENGFLSNYANMVKYF